MNCIIIDDDEISRRSIEMCITRAGFLSHAGSFSSVSEALHFLATNKTDIIFLDVELPEISGLDFMKSFKGDAQIIVVSGKKEYAAEAFDYNVTDYLVKPIDFQRFVSAVSKAAESTLSIKVSQTLTDDIFIKKDSRLIKVNARDILYVEALADYVSIYCSNNVKHTLLATMKLMEDKLKKTDFARIHRSYIIRLDRIKEIEENSVAVDGKVLPISRSYKDNLFNKLNLI